MNTALLYSPSSLFGRLRGSALVFISQHRRGITLCMAITGCAYLLATLPVLLSLGINPILLAMAGGIMIGNFHKPDFFSAYDKGISFSKQKLLRLGIILFGFRLTFADIGTVGFTGIAIDACVLLSTLALSWVLGRGVLRLPGSAYILVGAGSSICGAAAILATEPVIKAKPEEVSMAVACVVLFGMCATLLYPFLYHLNLEWHILPLTHHAFGLYIGSTIHEVAQVAATAQLIDENIADTAVIEKMARVMMLPLFLIALQMLCMNRKSAENQSIKNGKPEISCLLAAGRKAVPWFAVWFCIAIAVNSFAEIPHAVKEWLLDGSTWLLAMAMAALGIGTKFSAFNRNSLKLLGLAALLFAWLVLGGAAINHFFHHLPV